MDNVYEGFRFFNTLPSDRHLDIGHHVSKSYCRCSSGDGVDLLSRTICTTMVVGDRCIINLAYYYAVKTFR